MPKYRCIRCRYVGDTPRCPVCGHSASPIALIGQDPYGEPVRATLYAYSITSAGVVETSTGRLFAFAEWVVEEGDGRGENLLRGSSIDERADTNALAA